MKALAFVRLVRLRLALVLAASTLIWASAAGLGVLAAFGALAAAAQLPSRIGAAVPWLAVLASLATLAILAWRSRAVASLQRVALWIEERVPGLEYALVTAVDPRYAGTLGDRLDLPAIPAEQLLRRAVRRGVLPPLVALGVFALALAILPSATASSMRPGGAASAALGDATGRPARLVPLRVVVSPPEYARAAGIGADTLEDPTTIAGLAGSEVAITGPGTAAGLQAWLGDSLLAIEPAGERWILRFALPLEANLLRLADGDHRRSLVLAPRADQAPRLQLLSPARDTALRTAEGSLVLRARVSDDIGAAVVWFEYIISSGEGEGNYTFRYGTLGRRDLGGARQGVVELRVPFAQFELKPGDRLSVRAVALDGNTVTGPGKGYSETRLLRLAHPSEYDSLAVTGAPPAVDSTLMTLRYLIQLTEELHEASPRLEREVLVDSSAALGRHAERLRDRVGVLQADQTLGGLFEGNPLLDSAYLALTEGATALYIAEPGSAIPHLWESFRLLVEYGRAEKYYTRGGTPDVLVDLARVRLAGADTGRASPRTPREPSTSERNRLRDLYYGALSQLATDREEAVDRLLELQVEALRIEPRLAALLDSAIAGLRQGRDLDGHIGQQIRQILEGGIRATDTLPRWSETW